MVRILDGEGDLYSKTMYSNLFEYSAGTLASCCFGGVFNQNFFVFAWYAVQLIILSSQHLLLLFLPFIASLTVSSPTEINLPSHLPHPSQRSPFSGQFISSAARDQCCRELQFRI